MKGERCEQWGTVTLWNLRAVEIVGCEIWAVGKKLHDKVWGKQPGQPGQEINRDEWYTKEERAKE